MKSYSGDELNTLRDQLKQALADCNSLGDLLGHSVAQAQELVASWGMVANALEALNDPERLRRLAEAILSQSKTHPTELFYEEYPEFIDLEDTFTHISSKYFPPKSLD